ncbi:hypothetical protein ACTGVR_08900 [Streptococcus suis]
MKKVGVKFCKLFGIRVNYRPLGKHYREEPIDIYAFIRARNEIKTIETCLNSILPVIQKGVIGYNKLPDEEDDGTEEFILEFCRENKGFIPFRYEHEVIPANDLRYKELSKIPLENRFDTYTNEVWNKIPKDAWVLKIDCDHVFDTEKLSQLGYIPKKDTDAVVLSRMNFHYSDDELYVVNIHTIVASGEWQLIKNRNIKWELITGNRVDGSFFAWEVMNVPHLYEMDYIYTDLFNWHFPFIKETRGLANQYFTKFDDFPVTEAMKKEFGIADDMLDRERILTICRSFK